MGTVMQRVHMGAAQLGLVARLDIDLRRRASSLCR